MKVELLDGFWSFCPAKGQKEFASSTSSLFKGSLPTGRQGLR